MKDGRKMSRRVGTLGFVRRNLGEGGLSKGLLPVTVSAMPEAKTFANVADLPEQIVEKSIDPELVDVAGEFADLGLDQLLDENVLKHIPVIKTILSVLKAGSAIRDKLFVAKIAKFLLCLREVAPEEREKFRARFDKEPELKKRVGETLTLIIDRLDALDKAEILAWVFKAFLREQIGYPEFRRLATAIDLAFTDDLLLLTGRIQATDEYMAKYLENLARTGLAELDLRIGAARIERAPDVAYEYRLTNLGKLLLEIANAEIEAANR